MWDTMIDFLFVPILRQNQSVELNVRLDGLTPVLDLEIHFVTTFS